MENWVYIFFQKWSLSMGDTCSIWAVKLYWLDKFLLNTVTDQDIILLVPDSCWVMVTENDNDCLQFLQMIFTLSLDTEEIDSSIQLKLRIWISFTPVWNSTFFTLVKLRSTWEMMHLSHLWKIYIPHAYRYIIILQ